MYVDLRCFGTYPGRYGTLKERDHYEEMGVDLRIILKES
jgi:hypothetical protein